MIQESTREASGKGLRALAKWVTQTAFEDIPTNVRQSGIMILADDLSAMVSAEDEPQVLALHRALVDSAVPGPSSLYRRGRPRLQAEYAAMGNAIACCWNELDEGYRKAVCHAGLYTIPTILALAEQERSTLRDVVRALVLSYEVTARFARAWPFKTLKIHPHALYCALGATAAAGILRKLDTDSLIAALASATTLGVTGPYTLAVRGVLVRNAWAAAGISNGLRAIEWAHAGIGGMPETPHDVYCEALGSDANPAELTAKLGEEWAVRNGYHKINACCQYAHSAIAAVEQLIFAHPELLEVDRIQEIRLITHAYGMTLDNYRPQTILGAKFSLPFAVATSLVFGHGKAGAFDTKALADERVARLIKLVRMAPVPDEKPWPNDRPAYLTITTTSGEEYKAQCLSARGGPDQPFSDDELWSKIGTICDRRLPRFTSAMKCLHKQMVETDELGRSRPRWIDWADVCFESTGSEEAKH